MKAPELAWGFYVHLYYTFKYYINQNKQSTFPAYSIIPKIDLVANPQIPKIVITIPRIIPVNNLNIVITSKVALLKYYLYTKNICNRDKMNSKILCYLFNMF